MLTWWVILSIGGTGLFAGLLGGLLGIGGATVMIPALVILFGQGVEHPGLAGGSEDMNQHLYQAAAMIAGVFISIPAAWRHHKHGAIVPEALVRILPAALVATVLGVWISNLPIFSEGWGGTPGPVLLGRVLALFLAWVIVGNIRRLVRPRKEEDDRVSDRSCMTLPRGSAVGGATGLVAGLTGLGGGAIAVPLQQILLKIRLRNGIANSSAMICVTGTLGAIYKNATLSQHDLPWVSSLVIAVLLAPTAMVAGYFGAHLTHVLPVRVVRVAFIGLLIVAAWKMLGI